MKVTKITIGRLHNLGNYEHIRYELTAEIKGVDSPTMTLIGMEKIIDALNPLRPVNVPSKEESEREANHITRMRIMSDEDFKQQYLGYGSKATRESYIASHEKSLAEGVDRFKKWKARAAKARELLEDLGGAANWKDAKLGWEEDCPDDY